MYKCPVCNNLLNQIGNIFACERGHSYDIANEGYVNLLLANQKASKNPGDDKEMLLARREFLEANFYDNLINKICDLVKNKPDNFLDIGCGEGYYTNKISQTLGLENTYGMDISKPAVQLAAKKYSGINFSVASSERLPYLDNSFDYILSVFAPFNESEVARVLKPAGVFIVVGPGENHMKELAKIVYEDFTPHQKIPVGTSVLKFISEEQVSYSISPDSQNLLNIWKMSPYYWHSKEGSAKLVEKLKKITIDFKIDIYETI